MRIMVDWSLCMWSRIHEGKAEASPLGCLFLSVPDGAPARPVSRISLLASLCWIKNGPRSDTLPKKLSSWRSTFDQHTCTLHYFRIPMSMAHGLQHNRLPIKWLCLQNRCLDIANIHEISWDTRIQKRIETFFRAPQFWFLQEKYDYFCQFLSLLT